MCHHCIELKPIRRITSLLLALAVLLMVGLAGLQAQEAVVDTGEILAELRATGAPFECEDRCNHEILGTWPVKTSAGAFRIVVAATDDTSFGGCHACGKTLSFFAFRNEGGKWLEKWRFLAAMTRGSWGEFDKSQISAKAISSDDLAIFVEGSFLGQGTSVTMLEIYVEDGGKLKRLFNSCIAADNSGVYDKGDAAYYQWQARYELMPKDGGLFDLKINLEDKAKGTSTISLFSFKGEKYQSANADKRLTDPYSGCNPE